MASMKASTLALLLIALLAAGQATAIGLSGGPRGTGSRKLLQGGGDDAEYGQAFQNGSAQAIATALATVGTDNQGMAWAKAAGNAYGQVKGTPKEDGFFKNYAQALASVSTSNNMAAAYAIAYSSVMGGNASTATATAIATAVASGGAGANGVVTAMATAIAIVNCGKAGIVIAQARAIAVAQGTGNQFNMATATATAIAKCPTAQGGNTNSGNDDDHKPSGSG